MIRLFGLGRRAAGLVQACSRSGARISLAESCTGGFIAKLITDIPGSSSVLWGGLVVYSNEAKARFAGVRPETLAEKGAVSEATVRELVEGLLSSTPADIALAAGSEATIEARLLAAGDLVHGSGRTEIAGGLIAGGIENAGTLSVTPRSGRFDFEGRLRLQGFQCLQNFSVRCFTEGNDE